MDVIEKLLVDLHGSIESRDCYSNSVAIVASIEAVALGEVDGLELDICSNLLFVSSNPPCLLDYLLHTIRFKDREVIKSKVSTLKFIAEFLKRNPNQGDVYGVAISLTLIDAFKKEDSGEVKAALLLPLKNLFRCRLLQWSRMGDDASFRGVSLDPSEIKLEQMYLSVLDELRYGKKVTKGVTSESLKLLGILVGAYALESSTIQYAPIIINFCNQTLRENFRPSCKDPDFPAIAGCFSCLDRIFFQYEENCENSSELWKYLLQTVQTVNSSDISKFAAAAKAVRLIKNHAGLFKNLIGLNASQSYEIVMAAHKTEKSALVKHSADALSAIMTQISTYLVEKTAQNLYEIDKLNIEDALQTISSLIDGYLLVLKDGSRTESEDAYLSLKGIINCSSSIPRVFLLSNGKQAYNPVQLIDLIVTSARHSELLASVASSSSGKTITQFSSQKKSLYLAAVVSVIFSLFLDGIRDMSKQQSFIAVITNPSILAFLDEYITLVIIGYVKLWKKQQFFVHSALLKLLFMSFYGYSCGKFDMEGEFQHIHTQLTVIPLHHIQEITFQTLITRTSSRKEIDETLNVDSTRISEYTGEVDDRLLYGYLSLWFNLAKCSDKTLKLEILQTYGPAIFEDANSKVLDVTFYYIMQIIKDLDLKYVKADDLTVQDVSWIPTNIVDQDLLININSFFTMFVPEQPKKSIAKLFDKFLLELVNLAHEHPLVSSLYKLIFCLVKHVDHYLDMESNRILSTFILSVQAKILNNAVDFRGELLDASLSLVLSSHIVSVDKLVPSIRKSLLTGSNVATAVQQLTRAIIANNEVVRGCLPDLVPLMQIYLERFAQRVDQQNRSDKGTVEDSQIVLQSAILEFLGRIGGMNKLILSDPSMSVQDSLVWGNSKVLDIAMNATDVEGKLSRMVLTLDEVFISLTKLCEKLVLTEKDDQMLLSSCEALHSLLVLLLGNSSVAKRHKESEFAAFFKNALPVVVKFGSKPLKCQKMFELLLLQIARWFSGEGNVHEDESTALLEVLFASISSEDVEHSERDLSSRALEVYFSWCIKQSNRDVKSNTRVISFLSKVVTLLSHPLKNFRRGGIIALSKIYKHFREENYLVSRYVMQFIILLLNATRDNDLNSNEENELTFYKYEEILAFAIAKRGWMNEMINVSDDRAFPYCLQDLVKWLWENAITSSEKLQRRCCMRCFVTFSPLLSTTNPTESSKYILQFLGKWTKDEGYKDILDGVHTVILNDFNSNQNQLLQLEGYLDIYTWLLSLDMIRPMEFCLASSKNILDRLPQVISELLVQSEELDLDLDTSSPLLQHKLSFVFRYMIWIQTILKKAHGVCLDETVSFLRRNNYWGDCSMRLLLFSLSQLDAGYKIDSNFTISFDDFLSAMRHVMKFLSVLEENDLSSLNCKIFQNFVISNLQKIVNPSPTGVSAKDLRFFKSLLHMIDSHDLNTVIFGPKFIDAKQEFIDSIYNRMVIEMDSKSDSENELIEMLFQLSVDLGLQWNQLLISSPIFSLSLSVAGKSPCSDTFVRGISLVDILKSDHGAMLLRKAYKVVVVAVFRPNSNLSFFRNSNIITLLDLLPSTDAAFLLEMILLELSSRLSKSMDQAYVDVFLNNILPALQSYGYRLLPDTILTELLTIEAQANLIYSGLMSKCNEEFLLFIFDDCCNKFHSSAKCSVSTLLTRLNWLPYILKGTVGNAPRKRSKQLPFSEEKAIESLEEFVSLRFPLDSQQLNPAGEQGKDYLNMLEAYLTSLEQCGSVALLKPLLSSFREGPNHRYYHRLCEAIKSVANDVALPGPTDNQTCNHDFTEVKELCNFCIDLILDSLQDFIVKRTFFELLFLPTISKMNSKQVVSLFSIDPKVGDGLRLQHENSNQTLVRTMYEIVVKEVSLGIMEDEFEVKGKLYLQIACFKIFGFLYDFSNLTDIKTSLTQAYVGSEAVTGKELTQALCKVAFKVSKSSFVSDERFRSLVLELQSSAYECLAITVSKTQSDEQFFDTFLFKVKPGEDLWNRITFSSEIGDNPGGLFCVVSGNFPTQRLGWEKNALGSDGMTEDRKHDALRKMVTHARLRSGKGGFLSQYLSNSILGTSSISQSQNANISQISNDLPDHENLGRYSQSQYLDEDTNFARTVSIRRTYDTVVADEGIVQGWDDHIIYLELNHMNTVPIMSTMVRTLTRMHKLFAEKWKSLSNLPFWLLEMRTRLMDRSCCQRVRLFILRLLMNQPIAEIVKSWIPELLPPILDCALEDLCSGIVNNDEKKNINYFLRDLIFLFCDTWKGAVPDTMSSYQGSKLLNYLLENIATDEGVILKENTTSICALLRHWMSSEGSADLYNLSLKSVVDMISVQSAFTGGAHARASSQGTIAVRSRLSGLEVLQTLLESGYNILAVDESLSLVNALIGCVKFPRKEVIESSCMICGLLLQKRLSFEMSYRVPSAIKQLMGSFMAQLVQCVEHQMIQKFGADLMVSSIRSITITFPQFFSRDLIMKTLHCFPQLKFRQRYHYLDAIRRVSLQGEDVRITDLFKPYYKSLLAEVSVISFGRGSKSMKLPVVQVATICLLTEYRKELSLDILNQLLGDSEADGIRLCVSHNTCLQVRDAAFQFLMLLLIDHPLLTTSTDQEGTKSVKSRIYFLLLNGLTDPDDNGMNLEWTSKHEIFHSPTQYEDPVYWLGSTNSNRIGIRRRLLEFFNYDFGLTNVLSNRIQLLMSEFFDPANSEGWLKYSSYLLLVLIVTNSASPGAPLFNHGLGNSQNHLSRDMLAAPEYLGSSSLSSTTPMFALERTTQSLSQLVNVRDFSSFNSKTQLVGIGTILSQANMAATQSFIARRNGSATIGSSALIRGTQQLAWTQTQSQSPVSGNDLISRGPHNGNNPIGVPVYGTHNWTQSQDSLPSTRSEISSSSSSNPSLVNHDNMPPPPRLPSYIINQRVPSRISASMLESEGGKNYSLFRKVQVAKKLRNEEETMNKRRVSFFRRYKTGEIPDICIPLSDLIIPLASVCLQHSGLASVTLQSILSTLQANLPDFNSRIMSTISNIFNSLHGHALNSTFVSFLLKQLSIIANNTGSSIASLKMIADIVSKDSLVADLATQTGNYYTTLSLLEDLVCAVNKSIVISTNSHPTNIESEISSKRKRVTRKKPNASSSSSVMGSANIEDSDAIANDLFDNGTSYSSNVALSQSKPCSVDEITLSPIWGQLLRVYDELQENEVMISIAMKAVPDSSKAHSLKCALDAELRGEYLTAIEIYGSLLEACKSSDNGGKKRSYDQISPVSSINDEIDSRFEKQLWFDRSLSCHMKLGDWGKLHDFISTDGLDCVITSKESSSNLSMKRNRMGGQHEISFLDEICSGTINERGSSTKGRLIPHYFRSLLNFIPNFCNDQVSEDSVNPVSTKAFTFIDKMLQAGHHNASKTANGKMWFERTCSLELAIASAIKNDWSRVNLYSEMAYDDFLKKWSSLHPCALPARKKLLLCLEEILEVRDIAAIKVDPTLCDDTLMEIWSSTEPSLSDSLSNWTNIALIRQAGLGISCSSSKPRNNLHMAKFYVRSAVASVQQGILTMVKPLLEKNSILRKPVFGKKMVLTMDEVMVVSQYTKKNILRKPLESADIPAMFQKANGLLQKKMELLDNLATMIEDKSSLNGAAGGNDLLVKERYMITMLQAEWSAFAAKYEQDKLLSGLSLASTLAGVTGESIQTKKLQAVHNYFSALELVQKSGSNLHRWKESAFSAAAQYADQLLIELEQGQFDMTANHVLEMKNKLEELCSNDVMMMELLRSRRKSRDGSTFKATEMVSLLTVYLLLQGLAYGSSFCSERILRLVSVVEKYSDILQDFFVNSIKKIPAWVFLRYSAQMLGGLDREEGKIVVTILESVAHEYPQALYYSYRITSENFGKQGRYLSGKLDKLLANKHVDAFIEALTGLTHPELRWSDGMKEVEGRCKVYFDASNKLSNKEKVELGNSILGLFDSIKKMTIEQAWDKVGTKIGRYNIKWAKQIKAEVQSIIGKDDSKLLSNKTIIDKLKALSNKSDPQLSAGKVDLQEFSQWLMEYSDVNGCKLALEIPGQYGKYIQSKPAVDTHEFISSFDEKVLIMASIRKPKRVKIFGHLGNESFFLVKGGEDLRNDERIEQLFMLMNYVLDSKMSPMSDTSLVHSNGQKETLEEVFLLDSEKSNAVKMSTPVSSAINPLSSIKTFHHGFSARTYTVIPMSTKCGMLEWVKNTIPLKSIISEELAKDADFLLANPNCLETEESVDLSRITAYKERFEWIGSHKTPDYHKCFKNATREQAWQVFSSVSGKVPTDLLKKFFKRLALSAEAFFTLRTEFAKSLAVCSIFGYLLGMGDRHLDNLLIDMKTGSVVQIDFGICFGIGASMLPVPELIPFRLTPILRETLQPLDCFVLLRQYMSRVLQYLRDDAIGNGSARVNSDGYNGVIANALEIYINDPVVDWLRGITAKDKDELEAQREALESAGKVTWEPTRRVRMAVRKLKGEDPILLLLEDLKVNSAVGALDSYKSLSKILHAVRCNSSVSGGTRSCGGSITVVEPTSSYSGPIESMAWGDSMLVGASVGETGVDDNDPSRSKSIPVHDQVDLLLKLATDPDILARQWTGLQTWL